MNLISATWELLLEAAPWLVLGLVAAGLVKAWVPDGRMARWLGGSGPWPVVKAALLGAPLPLCSCGVLPAALGIRRAGASKGATVSFLIATPETGVDSVAVSLALLGPFLAVVRPVAAVGSAILAGLLVMMTERRPVASRAAPVGGDSPPFPLVMGPGGGIGGQRGTLGIGVLPPVPPVKEACGGGACCGGAPAAVAAPYPSAGVWRRCVWGLEHAFGEVWDDLLPWLGGGLVVAGAMSAWVPPGALAQWGEGLGAMGVMLLAGIPMYICATASTPVAAGLLAAGVSPGAVLVFMLAGPATNLATVGMVRQELGGWAMAGYLTGIVVGSVGCGLLVDLLAARWGWIGGVGVAGAVGELVPGPVALGCVALLVLTSIRPLRRRLFGKLDPSG